MNIPNKCDIAIEIRDLIEQRVSGIVEDETTIAAMYGFYTAHRLIYESAMKQFDSRQDAVNSLAKVITTYEYEQEYPQDVPLVLMRDYLEDFVRERMLPPQNDPSYTVVELVIDNYDWCDIASDMEIEFMRVKGDMEE